jgi:hypothetical protein
MSAVGNDLGMVSELSIGVRTEKYDYSYPDDMTGVNITALAHLFK